MRVPGWFWVWSFAGLQSATLERETGCQTPVHKDPYDAVFCGLDFHFIF